jgi:hypothetical protein
VREKANGGTLGDDPLAMYKPTSVKSVDAARHRQLHGLDLNAAGNAIASECANIRFRLCKVNRRAASTRRLRQCKRRHSRGGCWADT